MLYRLGEDSPKLSPESYIADSAQLIGKVSVAAGASVWMGAMLRGDIEEIILGANSNVQENSSLHTSPGIPLIIGENVTVGHSVTLHSCTIGDNSLIGMGSTILDGAEVGSGSLVAAASLLTPGQKFPENSFIFGSPAQRKKELGATARQDILDNAQLYCELGARYRKELVALSGSPQKRQAPQERQERQWKIAVCVPVAASDLLEEIKEALFAAGAGQLGLYQKCSWQSSGQGQFLPQNGSRPSVGKLGELQRIEEYKLEILCTESSLQNAIQALRAAHPYEVPAFEVYPVYFEIA